MTARLSAITRHPIKGHGREDLAAVRLSEGAGLPFDRHWAVQIESSDFDPAAADWARCRNFQRAAQHHTVMAIDSRLDEATGTLALRHPQLAPLTFRPDAGGEAFIDWIRPISPPGARAPKRLVSTGRALTDSAFPSISLNSLATHRAVEEAVGRPLSRHRWRGNIWFDDLPAFAERDWIGREIAIGAAVLRVEETIGRCMATTVNPDTGESDADTMGALRRLLDVTEFGVYATVLAPGEIRTGDPLRLI